jgi:hypothetical protein
MSIDLSQYLYRCCGGEIALVKHDDNMAILLNGKNTQDPPCNIRWTHLSEPKSIEILYKNIQASVHVISTFFEKHLKRINLL